MRPQVAARGDEQIWGSIVPPKSVGAAWTGFSGEASSA
jgi:hypothetical protein